MCISDINPEKNSPINPLLVHLVVNGTPTTQNIAEWSSGDPHEKLERVEPNWSGSNLNAAYRRKG